MIMENGGKHRFDTRANRRPRETEEASEDVFGFKQMSKKQKTGVKHLMAAVKAAQREEEEDAPGPVTSKRSVLDRLGAVEDELRANPAIVKRRKCINEMMEELSKE